MPSSKTSTGSVPFDGRRVCGERNIRDLIVFAEIKVVGHHSEQLRGKLSHSSDLIRLQRRGVKA